ncbi:MAG: pilus assembly PilX N-terminal domain-containing protein [Candidatus Saccharimonadales bacterium]
MNMHKGNVVGSRLNNSGAVSMITVIFVTIILAVMVIGFVRLMVSEQRQSTDDDLSNRAFYAAESGIEDAKSALADYMADSAEFNAEMLDRFDDCEPFGEGHLIADPSLETEITCQLVKTSLPDVQVDGSAAWSSFMIPLSGEQSFNRFRLEWHNPANDGENYSLKSNNSLPTTNNWGSGGNPYPAAMKVTLVKQGISSNTSREDVINSTRIVYLLPTSGGVSTLNTASSNFGLGDSSPQGVNCTNSSQTQDDSYSCRVDFTNLLPGSNDYYVILTPLYTSTSIKLSLRDNGGNLINIVDAQAEVDVTARAGDIFRRVRARVLLSDPAIALVSDLAVGANEICKDYILREDPNESGNSFTTINPGISNYCMQSPAN